MLAAMEPGGGSRLVEGRIPEHVIVVTRHFRLSTCLGLIEAESWDAWLTGLLEAEAHKTCPALIDACTLLARFEACPLYTRPGWLIEAPSLIYSSGAGCSKPKPYSRLGRLGASLIPIC